MTGQVRSELRIATFLIVVIFSQLVLPGTCMDSSGSVSIVANIVSSQAPVADFTASPISGAAPLTVTFTDLSTGSPTLWKWDFENDGIIDDTVRNPVHVYSVPGIYTVTLKVKNAVGSDTEVRLRYITVKESDAHIRIEALKQYIHRLPIPAWSKWFLTMPLDRALDQLEKGHGKPAIIQMKVFIGSVELLDRFHIVTHAQSNYMIGEARVIIDLIQ